MIHKVNFRTSGRHLPSFFLFLFYILYYKLFTILFYLFI
nr:MAG TPA: hypothetical protein [Caudoviricetes sp.]